MALADTARLVASLELQDKFSGPAKRVDSSIGRLETNVGRLGQAGQRAGKGIASLASNLAKLAAGVVVGGIAALTVQIKAGTDALHELENVQVATATVLESTNQIAGISAKTVRSLAEEYESLNATIDDKVIQSAANMLLTFTNVRGKAFEPALEAALNLNEAMGGGEEGLQANLIRVGRALNDPIKGLGTLSRAGVQFSDEQKKRIKRLQEEGKLYEAQQVILDELATQFGGRFAAAGQTAEGRMAKLGDAVEDLQIRLAGPLQPAIDKVRDKLISLLSTDRARQAAEKIGESIASIFSDERIDQGGALIGDLLEKFNSADFKKGFGTTTAQLSSIATTVGGLPWQAIGDAAKLLGTGSKALLDAFLGLPPWVQTAVLTGWGLNKLTGGALGTIVSELGKGLIKGVLNMNAAVVNVNARTVTGAGGGLPTGGPGRNPLGSIGSNLLKLVPVIGALELGANLAGGTGPVGGLFDREGANTPALKNGQYPVVDEAGERSIQELGGGLPAAFNAGAKDLTTQVTIAAAIAAAHLRADENSAAQESADLNTIRGRLETGNVRLSETRRAVDQLPDTAMMAPALSAIRTNLPASTATLAQIRDKRSTVNVSANFSGVINVSASNVTSQVQAYTFSTGGRTFLE